METFKNAAGKPILLHMVKAIQENKAFLGEVDGLIGDGDHGMNMAKGFTLFEKRIPEEVSFSDGLDQLGTILFSEIGGSMGPIYGTIFMDMAAAAENAEDISLPLLADMMESGLTGLQEIVEARVGDKTLVDTLSPAVEAMKHGVEEAAPFADTLKIMKTAAECGRNSTKDMVAKFGRSSRLGERSRGVLDAGGYGRWSVRIAGRRKRMKLAIGCDEAAYRLKTIIMEHLEEKHPEIEVADFGAAQGDTVLYPDVAYTVADAVASGEFQRGILLCGTGIGMCICANKVPGIRAAVCHDPYSAERSRKSNNAQIMCMGERVIGAELAKTLVDTWLPCEFAGGGSAPKVAEIDRLEQEHIRNAVAQ